MFMNVEKVLSLFEHKNLAIFIPLIFLLLFSVVLFDYVGLDRTAVDYQNILGCITSGTWIDKEYNCSNYPPLWIWIGKLFVGRPEFYDQFVLVVFALVTPLVMYKITKNPITSWFYFSTTSFFYATITSAFFSQAFAYTLILSMYFQKDWQRILTLVLLILAHSSSFIFGLIFFIGLSLQNKRVASFLASCSPFWNQNPDFISSRIAGNTDAGYFTLNSFFSALTKKIPLPFLYFATKELVKRKEIGLLVYLIVSVLAGVFVHERGFYFAALPMVIGLTWYYEKTSNKMKLGLILLSFLQFVLNIEQLVLLKLNCL